MQLRINADGFNRVRATLPNNELARLLGLDPSVVRRVLSGHTRPGNRFIAGVWSLFGDEAMKELFTVMEEDGDPHN